MRRTPSWLKQQLEADKERDHKFFTRGNMDFAGDKMSNFGLRLVTVEGVISEAEGVFERKRHEAWELYRKHPVKGNNKASFFFRCSDLKQVRSARNAVRVVKPREYAPRRAGIRWLRGAPKAVLDLFHDKKAGRYEVLYGGPLLLKVGDGPRTSANTRIQGREMDSQPSHPQGLGMSFELSAAEAAAFRYRNGKHRCKWSDLPEAVKKCIVNDTRTQ